MTCGFTPYYLAFPEGYDYNMAILDLSMNVVFGIDLFYNFFSAYYDEDFQIIDSLKVSNFKV